VRHWHRLPVPAVDAPSLEMFKARLYGVVGSLIWWVATPAHSRRVTIRYLRSLPSQAILWFYDQISGPLCPLRCYYRQRWTHHKPIRLFSKKHLCPFLLIFTESFNALQLFGLGTNPLPSVTCLMGYILLLFIWMLQFTSVLLLNPYLLKYMVLFLLIFLPSYGSRTGSYFLISTANILFKKYMI